MLGTGLDTLFVQPDELTSLKRNIDHDNYVRDREVKLKKKDTKPLDCLLTLSIRRAENGDISGYQGIIRDVTHQKVLENTTYAGPENGIHWYPGWWYCPRFNNILSPIMLHSEMVMDVLRPDDPVQLNMKEIFKASERARDLVNKF